MESVGKFEFNRKDLIGHGAFAVVFKGRHKEKRDWEVAVKCINKKNIAKSQALLGKEIKILKELKHENIVRLLDYQVRMFFLSRPSLYLLTRTYCNGGDLAEYLHCKGTLSEDTIRVFLQQIAQAMKVLQSKGILHRDLKPQNILLCHPEGRRSSSINASIKIADFGFARHLQTNAMAATLCGSPMYMAPEVIMSQNYDAKADLWSIGTIVYQCLTGKAPFHASTPQELRLFYESNRNLLPSVPKETSSHLRHLLLGLLQRNHKERMSFDEFFHHPFLESSTPPKKSVVVSYPSSGSGSSSSSSSASQLASPQHSDGEMHQLQPGMRCSPTQDNLGLQLRETATQQTQNGTSYTEDYVMVPAQFPGTYLHISVILLFSHKRHSVAIPVPTQIQNFQRMEQNLQPVGLHGSTRHMICMQLPHYMRTVPNLQSLDPSPPSKANMSRKSDNKKGPFKRSLSTGKLSDMLLKAAFGTQLLAGGSDENLNSEKGIDIAVPPAGCHVVFQCSDSPPPAVFMMGSPSSGNISPDTIASRAFSGTSSDFNALSDLRFTLAFVHCVMELASSKDPGLEVISSPDVSFLERSVVTDQISLLSREWRYAEQLVLYMKAEEFLSAALRNAKENIKQGQLVPSATVKQVIRKLNELYKSCVTYCRSLNNRLQAFLLDKQKLIDHFNELTAEKLIYSHTVHMVQSAALDEMFHCGTTSVQRYHKALLLMEGLSRNLTEENDIENIDKCKQCIERRLSALET
uniref:non-specific serine/threonine protein kinase n=1 Tax=Salarias fasciatus TaxID=181472 RepID=A0A672JM30_SALFA